MKTTFKQYLQEAKLPRAKSKNNLMASIKDGKFTVDGSKLSHGKDFNCKSLGLVSLEGVPDFIGGSFWCRNNKLTSLEGGPTIVGGEYNCSENKLTSLEGSPSIINYGFFANNNILTSLKGAPDTVKNNFSCDENQLTSLEGAPKIIGDSFFGANNKLTSLKDIHLHILSIGRAAEFTRNPIESHILGLLKIKNLKQVKLDNKQVEKIINKYLPEGDLMDCQQELIDADFEEFAKL